MKTFELHAFKTEGAVVFKVLDLKTKAFGPEMSQGEVEQELLRRRVEALTLQHPKYFEEELAAALSTLAS
jgi:hypothetical protein